MKKVKTAQVGMYIHSSEKPALLCSH